MESSKKSEIQSPPMFPSHSSRVNTRRSNRLITNKGSSSHLSFKTKLSINRQRDFSFTSSDHTPTLTSETCRKRTKSDANSQSYCFASKSKIIADKVHSADTILMEVITKFQNIPTLLVDDRDYRNNCSQIGCHCLESDCEKDISDSCQSPHNFQNAIFPERRNLIEIDRDSSLSTEMKEYQDSAQDQDFDMYARWFPSMPKPEFENVIQSIGLQYPMEEDFVIEDEPKEFPHISSENSDQNFIMNIREGLCLKKPDSLVDFAIEGKSHKKIPITLSLDEIFDYSQNQIDYPKKGSTLNNLQGIVHGKKAKMSLPYWFGGKIKREEFRDSGEMIWSKKTINPRM